MDADSSRMRFDRVVVPRSHEPIRLFPISQTVYKYLYLDRETGTLYNGSLSCVYLASSEPLRMSDYPSRAGRSSRAKIYIFLNHIKASCDNPSAFLFYLLSKNRSAGSPERPKTFLGIFLFLYPVDNLSRERAPEKKKKETFSYQPPATNPSQELRMRN